MRIEKFQEFNNEMIELIISDYKEIYNKVGVTISNDDEIVTNSIKEFSKQTNLSGAVCINNDKVVGFMIGELIDEKKKVWVNPFGLAASGSDVDMVIYKLYKHCSKEWVNNGYYEHVIESLDKDSYIHSLQYLGFAFQQAHGLMKVSDYVEQESNAEIKVRNLENDDEDLLRKMATIILESLNDSPNFVSAPTERLEAIRNGYVRLINDKDLLFYIAETNEPVAFQSLRPQESEYLIPDNCIELSLAGTLSDKAYKGIGTKLMNHVVSDVSQRGFKWIVADWRITNISPRRFWKKCGFKYVKRRMVRVIESDFEWGKF